MILIEATIKYKCYNPNKLKSQSQKRICCSCDICGRVRWVRFQQYRDLCLSCSVSGKRHYNFGKHISKNQKQKQSNILSGRKFTSQHKDNISKNHADVSGDKNPMYNIHKFGKDAPNWKGGFSVTRSYVLPADQCIKLNHRFPNSDFHHITKSVGIYIPSKLHRHIWHNLKSGQGMGKINLLALQFINGEL